MMIAAIYARKSAGRQISERVGPTDSCGGLILCDGRGGLAALSAISLAPRGSLAARIQALSEWAGSFPVIHSSYSSSYVYDARRPPELSRGHEPDQGRG